MAYCNFQKKYLIIWYLQTTATIYSLVGALNKMPVAIFGLVIFHEPTNSKNLSSIILGLLAGVLFVRAKNTQPAQPARK